MKSPLSWHEVPLVLSAGVGVAVLVGAGFSASWYLGVLAMATVVIVIFVVHRFVLWRVAVEKPRPPPQRWHDLSAREQIGTLVLVPTILFLFYFFLATARTYGVEDETLGYSVQIGAIAGGIVAGVALGAIAWGAWSERQDETTQDDRFWTAYEQRTGRPRPGRGR